MNEQNKSRVGGGLDEWYPALKQVGILVAPEDVGENLKKESGLDALGLPRSRTFGFVKDGSYINKLPKDLRFVVRCVPLSDVQIARGVNFIEAQQSDILTRI